MATETVPAGATPATDLDLRAEVERTLDDVINRAMGVAGILDSIDFWDLAAGESVHAYAMAQTVDLVLKRLVVDAREAAAKIDAAFAAQAREVSHG